MKLYIKWLARIIGGLALVFSGLFFMGEGVPGLMEEPNSRLQSIMLLLGFAFLGYIFAWFREKEGGIVMMLSGVIMGMYIFYSGDIRDIYAVLYFSLPFLLPGAMFWWVGR